MTMGKFTNRNIYFATSNLNKYKEAEKILGNYGLKLYKTKLIEIKDDSLRKIALTSLQFLTESFNEPVFVDDSGFFIKALNGFPGPIAGYVHKKLGNQKILSLLKGKEDRSAYFKSVIAFKISPKSPITFEGKTYGKIIDKERGSKGFDYDPIFQPIGSDKTFGEMTTEEKNAFSHRGKALKKLRVWLEEEFK